MMGLFDLMQGDSHAKELEKERERREMEELLKENAHDEVFYDESANNEDGRVSLCTVPVLSSGLPYGALRDGILLLIGGGLCTLSFFIQDKTILDYDIGQIWGYLAIAGLAVSLLSVSRFLSYILLNSVLFMLLSW